MDIEVIKKNLKNLSEDSIIRFIADVVFKDMTNIKSYNPNEMYYKDMVVYKYDDVDKKHHIYKCIDNVVTGTFDPSKWMDYSSESSIDISEINSMIENKVNEIIFESEIIEPAGINWTSIFSAADNSWYSVCYGNGLFVAVSSDGSGNRVMTSPDGINWTSRTSAADNFWQSVCYGNGLFVAVSYNGTGNRVMTSPDGINWTIRSSAADNDWESVCYGNGLFVAVSSSGTGNRVMTSPDGINWTIRSSADNNNWRSICYGNGLFVAVSSSGTGNRVMTSPDGINWTSRTSAADNYWQSVCYGNGLFVAVSSSGTGNRVMTSPDGINWTSRSTPADNNWQSVCYGNGLFVAVSSDGTGNRVMTSPDGINWTIRSSADNNQWRSVCYGNGLFVAVSSTGTGNRVMTSEASTELVLNADKLGGKHASDFATAEQGIKADNALPSSEYTANDVLNKLKTVDGSGSGLDADTIDGIEGADLALASHTHDESYLRKKSIKITLSAYRNFVIPLMSLNNSSSSEYYHAFGDLYLYRNNFNAEQMINIKFMAGKIYNTTKPIFEINKTNNNNLTNIAIKPCKFTKDGIPFFGIYVITTGAGFTNIDFNGFSTNFDDIDCIYVYNNQTSEVINTEIYNSIELLTNSYNMRSREFLTSPYVLDSDLETRHKILHEGNIIKSTSDPTDNDGQDGDIWIKYEE